MIAALVLVFVVVVVTGPDGKEFLRKRKELRNRPLAQVIPFPYEKGHPKRV